MPVINLHLDATNKETLENLAPRGGRSAALRSLIKKYKDYDLSAAPNNRLRVNISITTDDLVLLQELAKKYDVSLSELVNRILETEKWDKELIARAF